MTSDARRARRDAVLAAGVAFLALILLAAWQPDFTPPPALPATPPPRIVPLGAPPAGDAPAAGLLQAVRSPALIALSAPLLAPAGPSSPGGTVAPPLDGPPVSPPGPKPAPLRPAPELLPAPPRPRSLLSAPAADEPAPHPLPPRPAYWADWTGKDSGVSLDLAPLLSLEEPAGAWSLTATLQIGLDGRVRQALIESAALEPDLRAAAIPRLYQCRVSPAGKTGELRLSLCGPGRAAQAPRDSRQAGFGQPTNRLSGSAILDLGDCIPNGRAVH